MNTKVNERNKSIDIIKGIACIIVFMAHYFDCFYWYSGLDKSNAGIINLVRYTPFYFAVCGGFMVSIFCLLSGYFAYEKKIDNFNELIKAIFKRYIFFLLHVMISNLVIYVGARLNVFPVEDAMEVLDNSKMPMFVAEIHTLSQSFLLSSSNGALWMIRALFLGNSVIYIYKYVCTRFNKIMRVSLFLILYVTFYYDEIIWITLTGVLFGYIMKKAKSILSFKRAVVLSACCVLWIGGINSYIIGHLPRLVRVFVGGKVQSAGTALILCIALVVLFDNSKRIINSKLSKYLIENCFSVYLIHIPIIYSFSISIWLLLGNAFEYEFKFIFVLVLTAMVVFVFSKIYTVTIGRICNKIIKKCFG
jgi:peptidoglycan/LPS O-acetylase OafA/YrhL